MSREPFEAMPDVMDAKQLAEALQISKAGAYNLLSSPDFPTLRIGGRKLVMKNELVEWLMAFAAKHPQCCRQTDDDEQGGLTFEIEKGRLSFRLTAPYSEERRKAASERARVGGINSRVKKSVQSSH